MQSLNVLNILKYCTKCKKEKPLDTDHFRKQSKTKDGFKYVCIECDDQAQKTRYAKIKDKYISKVREWQKNNPEKVSKYKQSSREN